MRNLILIALMTCLPAHAGEVYKCKGPKGEITFTNIKCPEHANAEHYATYEPEPDPPPAPAVPPEAQSPSTPASTPPLPAAQPAQAVPAVAPPSPTAVPQDVQQPSPPTASQVIQQPVQPPTQAVAQEPAPPEQPATDAPPTGGSGYRCSDGDEVWMQSTPCPAMAARSAPKVVERPMNDARPVSAVAANPKIPLNGSAPPPVSLCDQLIAQANTPGHPKSSAGADELDKLLAANHCKH